MKDKKKLIKLSGDDYLYFNEFSHIYKTHSERFEGYMLMNDIRIHNYELFLLGKGEDKNNL